MSSSRKMWFGPAGHLKQIKMPQGGGGHSPVGYSESIQYLSGRKAVRRSSGSHKEYDWTWRGSREEVQHLLDCADGIFGEAPFHFIDPMWARDNALPAHWAAPMMGASDAPTIYGTARPERVPTPLNDGSWPAFGASFKRDANAPTLKTYLPIPPGHGLYFWYAGTEGVVRLTPYSGSTPGAPIIPAVNDPSRPLADQIPTNIVNDGSVDGVMLSVDIPSTLTSATIYGMRAIVMPDLVVSRVGTNHFTNPNLLGSGTWAEVYRNYFTNPNLVGDGTWTEVYRNYFTNPRLVGDGTWAEIRRNHLLNPGARSVGATFASHWSGATGNITSVAVAAPTPWSASGASTRVTWSAVTVPDVGDVTVRVGEALNLHGAQVGETWTIAYSIRASSGVRLGVPNVVGTWSGVTIKSRNRTASVIADGETVYRDEVTFTITSLPDNNGRFGVTVAQKVEGSWVEVSMGDLYPGDAQPNRAYFDGVTKPAGFVQPEDVRVRWTGTENASASVMEGERVRGGTSTGCVLIVSTKNGRPAGRQIPLADTASVDTVTRFAASNPSASGQTYAATVTLDAPLSGTPASNSRGVRLEGESGTTTAPNAAGTHSIRGAGTRTANQVVLRLVHGGAAGSGDLWWTEVGLFGPGYAGPVFSGDAVPSSFTQPEDFRARWVGTPDASESVLEGEAPGNLTSGNSGRVIRSTRNGKPAIRVIAVNAASTESYASFSMPVALRPGGVAFATSDQDGPLTGTLHSRARRISYSDPEVNSDPGPNTAGPVLQRLEWASTSTYNHFRFYNGSRAGNGDVWWYDIGLFARGYNGPLFSGDGVPEGLVQPEDFRARWTGTPNASESVIEGETVRGFTANNAVGIVSTKKGMRALRLIPTNPTATNSYVQFIAPTAVQSAGVMRATVHLDAPLTGTLEPASRGIRTIQPDGHTVVPNTAGSHEIARDYSMTSAYRILLYHGGTLGSGDLWWTHPGLFDAGYTGPVFSGSDQFAVWNGTVDNSTSTLYDVPGLVDARTPQGFVGGRGNSGVDFEQHPVVTPYSVPYDSIGVTARLVEVDY